MQNSAQIGILMGSASDWEMMKPACEILKSFDVGFEVRVISAHRMPQDCTAYASSAVDRGLKAIICGAGGAAHLAGVVAAQTTLPVLGVPLPGKYIKGEDALWATVQMPCGIPVATFAIGEAGAANAALFAVAMLAANDAELAEKLAAFRTKQTQKVRAAVLPLDSLN